MAGPGKTINKRNKQQICDDACMQWFIPWQLLFVLYDKNSRVGIIAFDLVDMLLISFQQLFNEPSRKKRWKETETSSFSFFTNFSARFSPTDQGEERRREEREAEASNEQTLKTDTSKILFVYPSVTDWWKNSILTACMSVRSFISSQLVAIEAGSRSIDL